jgi:hypothetical protein
MPQNLAAQFDAKSGVSALDTEIMGEKAASLGRAGRLVEQRVRELSNIGIADANRSAVVQMTADAVQAYFVQRELCGLVSHDRPIEDYGIPAEVLARLGVVGVPAAVRLAGRSS